PIPRSGVYVKLRRTAAIQTDVIRQEETGERPVQRAESKLPAVSVGAQRQRQSALDRLGKRARLMGNNGRKHRRRSVRQCCVKIRPQRRNARCVIGKPGEPEAGTVVTPSVSEGPGGAGDA